MATPARDIVELVCDRESFEAWDEDVVSTDPLRFTGRRPYRESLADARARSGSSEAVVTGRARLAGRPLALIVGEFAFLGGSIGVATGERVARAFERAHDLSLPVLAVASSGGTRMQEGVLAFMQMAKSAAAARRFRKGGGLFVSYLTDPTTGGVLASWGSLGHLTFAQPGALVGFAGPRVLELTAGASLPAGVQRAENLLRRGLLDDVFALEDLRGRTARVLAALEEREWSPPAAAAGKVTPVDAWDAVRATRDPRRPGARELLDVLADEVTPMEPGHEPVVLTVLARVCGRPAVVVAHDRSAGPQGARITPGALRKARRALCVAAELGLPAVTVVDTPGAELSAEAEEGGLSAEIARCLADMSDTPSPTLGILLGQGGGGAALGLLVCDRVVAARDAWLSPIAPEGASAILFRTADRAPELARKQGITARELERGGIVDAVVESGGWLDQPATWLRDMAAATGRELDGLLRMDPAVRTAERARRYRKAGGP